MEQTVIAIEGMTCGRCVARVTKALQSVPGVRVDQVQIGEALVAYDPTVSSEARLREAVATAGFTPRPHSA